MRETLERHALMKITEQKHKEPQKPDIGRVAPKSSMAETFLTAPRHECKMRNNDTGMQRAKNKADRLWSREKESDLKHNKNMNIAGKNIHNDKQETEPSKTCIMQAKIYTIISNKLSSGKTEMQEYQQNLATIYHHGTQVQFPVNHRFHHRSASPAQSHQEPPRQDWGLAPHDMNKQGAPNRPALAPSPVQQGTILQGQQVLLNPAQIMYQQPNMARHQQAAMYVPLQPGQRGNPRMPMSNMTQTQQGGQPQTSYQQLTMSAPPFIPSSHHNAQQQQPAQFVMPPMMMPNTPMYAPRQQMQQVQYQHAPYLQQPNTPPFYSSSPPVSASTGAFFPQNPQTLVATQPPQLRSQGPTILQQQSTQQQQQQQQRLPPRERTIIRIVDPTSNQDITDALMREVGGTSSTGTTPTHSGRSSASSTPPASGPPPSTQQNPQLKTRQG
ncbi:uncharacterized protein [Amphiura filiformis]|uniref:uncharacterized protein n=1 Tax=Amphiura filiformis TaxID=82378 RepID=UPI003B21083B